MELNEEVNPAFNVERGLVGVNVDAVRDNINSLLAGVTACSTVTPYIALERVRKVLAQFHVFLPKVAFMEGDHGIQTFPIQQFGEMMGMRDDGEVVTKIENPYHLYFEYQMTDRGMFDVFCEIVNEDELEELLDDVEDEIEDEDAEDDREEKLDESSESVKLAGPETGPKPTPGAVSMGACAVAAYMNKKKEQKLDEARLNKDELTAIRLASKMQRKMEKPKAKISAEKIKPQDRKTKSVVKKKAEDAYKSMAAHMGDYDAQWRESERNNSAHGSKENIEKFMRLAKQEFDAARKAKPDMDVYRKKYFTHQDRMKALEGMMKRAKK